MKKHPQARCVAVDRGWESRSWLPLARIRSLPVANLRFSVRRAFLLFLFALALGTYGKHVEVHEMRADFVVDGFGEELPGLCRIGSGVGCSLPRNCLSRRKQLAEQSRFSSTSSGEIYIVNTKYINAVL